ncbi:hypothetical protein [uncultured Brevundimonas sp.]|uniref:hypothetical protein n=1 Tax=uncultured Brevundimonas sp. TaxID=213418 RepID=UPI002606B71D|nr:hypothetical protein [uncultured Brevundimonas sp.]
MEDHKNKPDESTNTPYAKTRVPEEGKPDQLADRLRPGESREEALVDEGVEETFPASDPVSAKHIT